MNSKTTLDPSRKKVLFWVVLAVVAAVILILVLRGKNSTSTAENIVCGSLVVEVVDGRTEQPLEGCQVVVVGQAGCYTTDAQGKTAEIPVQAVRCDGFDNILPQTWGETTLIVYRDGYIPYALFHAQVQEGEVRTGPRIYLFADDGSTQGRAFSVIEGPDRDWVNQLVTYCTPTEQPSASPSSSPEISPAPSTSPAS